MKEGHKLLGFLVYVDSGRIGMGDAIYALSTKNGQEVENALCVASGKLSKWNIVALEVLSSLLGEEDIYKLMQPLLYDHSNTALRFYFNVKHPTYHQMLYKLLLTP